MPHTLTAYFHFLINMDNISIIISFEMNLNNVVQLRSLINYAQKDAI